jgi:acyl-CoA reductase-like NAD-dependent aldehyde dehydrogenase
MLIAQEELFGPVAPIITVDDKKEGIRRWFRDGLITA